MMVNNNANTKPEIYRELIPDVYVASEEPVGALQDPSELLGHADFEDAAVELGMEKTYGVSVLRTIIVNAVALYNARRSDLDSSVTIKGILSEYFNMSDAEPGILNIRISHKLAELAFMNQPSDEHLKMDAVSQAALARKNTETTLS